MSEHIFLLTLSIPLATVLIIFGMKYFSAIQQAKARLAGDQAYHQLAAQAIAAQAEANEQLAALTMQLTEVRNHVASMDKLLKEVE